MKHLLKYEFRKTRTVKTAVLISTCIFEILFLLGLICNVPVLLGTGTMGLSFCATLGMLILGLVSITVLYRELNSPQSYMLFLTPNSSYKIIGAKVLENGITLAVGGICFTVLAGIDLFLWGVQASDFPTVMHLLSDMMGNIQPNPADIARILLVLFSGWLSVLTIAFFAVVVQASLLNGRRFGGLFSFLLFLAIVIGIGIFISNLPLGQGFLGSFLQSMVVPVSTGFLYSLLYLGFTALFYALTGWIMDKKLSV